MVWTKCFFFWKLLAFFRTNRIKASVFNTQSTKNFLSELNEEKNEHEKQFKADVNQKAFLKVVQKSLSQKRQKRTFKTIGKNLVLLKLFSHQPRSSSLHLKDPEERIIIWKKQLSSPSPKSKVPKTRPKGLGLTLKSHGTHPNPNV